MSSLRSNNPITANGDYDITVKNAESLKLKDLDIRLRLSGMAGTGDQVDLKELVGENDWKLIHSFTNDDGLDISLTSNKIRLSVSGYVNPIRYNLAMPSEVLGIS